jgi:septum site-determining protein MinC
MEGLRLAGHDPGDRGETVALRLQATRSGLRVRLPHDGDVDRVLADLSRALAEAGGIRGGAVTVDAGGRTLDAAVLRRMETLLLDEHGAALLQVVEGQQAAAGEPETGPAAGAGPGGGEAADGGRPRTRRRARGGRRADRAAGEGAAPWPAEAAPRTVPVMPRLGPSRPPADAPPAGLAVDMTPTLLVRRTLRSGQRVRYNGNVVVLGDVNPGAEIVAAGDIVVMGTLRGVAHAGATGTGDAIVAAFRLQPVQLRVGTVIGRAPDGQPHRAEAPELARVRDGVLVIERFLT